MGFEELGDAELIAWVNQWIGKVSGSVPIFCESTAEHVGTVTVSVQGDLQRLQLEAAAAGVRPDQLSHSIEQGYVEAYREALRQVGLVFDRLESDLASNPALLQRVRLLRGEYGDRSGLQRMLRRRQSGELDASWDPAADPLRRGV